jgi:hypothetical protein
MSDEPFIPAELLPHYRETLTRRWTAGGNYVLWILQNPSTATETIDDPTVRSCIAISQWQGFDGLVICNTYLRRASKPDDLYTWLAGITDMHRATEQRFALAVIEREMDFCTKTIVGWGNGHPRDKWPDRLAWRLVQDGNELWCLGLTQSGKPIHPLARGKLRIDPKTVKLIPYQGPPP